MPRVTQPSFATGEISPEMRGRIDTSAYASGLAKARNALIHVYGGVGKRPGTRFVGPCKDHTYAPRLIPFQFKTTDTYMLEFGDSYMRVIRDGGYVTEAATTITGVTNANPAKVSSTAHGYTDGDTVYITDIVGMTELNGRWFIVDNATANDYDLTHFADGSNIDSTLYSTYTSGGSAAKIYEIVTPYAEADLFEISYTQSADVMTLTHRNYAVQELSRTGHTAWTLSPLVIGPSITEPVGVSITVNTTGTETDYYKVTAIDKQTGEESLSGLDGTSATITGATAANPVVITATAHGFSDGDEVKLDSVGGMVELNGYRFIVTNSDANTFELYDVDGVAIDGTGYTAYTSGGIARLVYSFVTNSNATRDNTISWSAVTGAEYYLVYRKIHGIYGFIGETKELTFDDENYEPNTSLTIPNFRDPFPDTTDQPQAVGYYQQRRVFAGSIAAPDTTWYSQTGNQSNFNVSRPLQVDDAITATLASLEVNQIRHLIPSENLLVLTSGAEWVVNSGPDTAFGPTTINQNLQSTWGSSYVIPAVAGNTTIYVTADNASLRSFGYSFQIDGYTGSNLNILAQHLLRGHQIVDMTYQRNPEGRLYMVREDGDILAMTFDQDQEIIAWSTFDTDGEFEAVSSLPLGGAVDHLGHEHTHTEDAVYLIVKRMIDGRTVRYVETMIQNSFFDVRECFFVDSGLTFDEFVEITDITAANPVVVTAVNHGYANGDMVDILDVEWEPDIDSFFNYTQPAQLNGGRFTVANVTANTFELSGEDGSAFNAYVEGGRVRKAITTFSGAWHLEGEEVVALADGNVVTGLTITDGSVTLATAASIVQLGKRYITDIETLGFQIPNKNVQGRDKAIPAVVVKFSKSRGLLIGPDSDNLVEMKQREFEAFDEPTALLTGDKTVNITQDWNTEGSVFLRNPYPLPITILAITPEIELGEDNV